MNTDLADGLYAVINDRPNGDPHICAGLIVADGRVVEAAPILRRRLAWWLTSGYVRRAGP